MQRIEKARTISFIVLLIVLVSLATWLNKSDRTAWERLDTQRKMTDEIHAKLVDVAPRDVKAEVDELRKAVDELVKVVNEAHEEFRAERFTKEDGEKLLEELMDKVEGE